MHYEIVGGRFQGPERIPERTFHFASKWPPDEVGKGDEPLVRVKLPAFFDTYEPLTLYIEMEENQ